VPDTIESLDSLKSKVAHLLVECDRLAAKAKRRPHANYGPQIATLRCQIRELITGALAHPPYAAEIFTHQVLIAAPWPNPDKAEMSPPPSNTKAWAEALAEWGGELVDRAIQHILHGPREHTDQTTSMRLIPRLGWEISYRHTAKEAKRVYDLLLRPLERAHGRPVAGSVLRLIEIEAQFRGLYNGKTAKRWLAAHRKEAD
jgi:hypothetical protein